MSVTIQETSQKLSEHAAIIDQMLDEASKVIVGQRPVLQRFIIGLLTGGHVLIEGVPGLAKTLTIKTVAQLIDASFQRIQFTPDLLPADIVGTLIYHPQQGTFEPKLGPIFANVVLADEINRAPAKVQSALLEAMQEHQVTIGDHTHALPQPFMVMATQNPIEQEGTYPLPEAQVDRFLMKILIDYPSLEEEAEILSKHHTPSKVTLTPCITPDQLISLRAIVSDIYVDEKINRYVLDLVNATRFPDRYQLHSLKPLIDFGASPRASLSLIQSAKAHAFLNHRGYVTPDDIKAIGNDVLRHRVIPSLQADAENITPDQLLDQVFSEIEVP